MTKYILRLFEFLRSFLILTLLTQKETNGAKIASLSVPKWVQNGTEQQIILDCSYSVSRAEERNFALKWYFGSRSEVIYHWIPDLDFRFVNGRIQRRFNWDYFVNATNAKINKYRAISIKNPTTELSGIYICEVSTDQGTDSKSASMIIYAPPEEIAFQKKFLTTERRLLLSYRIVNIYPLPTVVIYQSCGNKLTSQRKIVLHDTSLITADSNSDSNKQNTYTLQHVQYIDFNDIIANHEKNGCSEDDFAYYSCVDFELTINGTDFVVNKSIDVVLPKDEFASAPVMSRLVAPSSSPSFCPKFSLLSFLFVLIFCQFFF